MGLRGATPTREWTTFLLTVFDLFCSGLGLRELFRLAGTASGTGSITRTFVPLPLRDWIRTEPPSAAILSRIPTSPKLRVDGNPLRRKPTPSSSTSKRIIPCSLVR
jgi:hypothetical protein